MSSMVVSLYHKCEEKAKEKTSVRGLRAECYPPKVAIRVRVPADAFLSSEEEVKKSNKKS